MAAAVVAVNLGQVVAEVAGTVVLVGIWVVEPVVLVALAGHLCYAAAEAAGVFQRLA
jgi:hypothetical protein